MGYAASRSLQDFNLEIDIVFSIERLKSCGVSLHYRSRSTSAAPLRFGYAFVFCAHAVIFSRQMAMIIIEAEAPQLPQLRSSSSIIIVLTLYGNIF